MGLVVFLVGTMVVANTINIGCVDFLVVGKDQNKLVSQFDKFVKLRICNIFATRQEYFMEVQ